MKILKLKLSFGLALFLLMPGVIYAQDPVKESEQLDFAQGLLSRGMYDMAILQYQKFISSYPHSQSLSQAYLSLGEGYFLSQEFDKAVDTFNQFMQLFPNSDQMPVGALRLGQIDLQQKKYDDAIKQLTSVDAQKLKGPLQQSFEYYTAEAYLGKTDTKSALDFFQKAAGVDGATGYTAYAFLESGKILAQGGHYQDALEAYAKALPQAGDDALKAELTYRSAETQFLAGNYTQAIKGFNNTVDQYPDTEFFQQALANLLLSYFNAGQYEDLLKVYKQKAKQIKNDETYFAVDFAAVLAYIELKDYDGATTFLDTMLAFPNLKPQDRAKVFIKKADILIRKKKYTDGLALLDAYSSQDIDDTDETSFLRGQAYFGLGLYDKSFNAFENVFLNFPNSRFYKAALLGQAHCRKETGRSKEAEALFIKYKDLQEVPELKSEALYDAVMMAALAQEVSQVIDLSQEYLKTFPNGEQYSDVLMQLADNYGQNDQVPEAIKLLQGYLASSQASQRPNAANFLLGFDEQSIGNSDAALSAYSNVDQHKEDGKFYEATLKNMAIIYLIQKKYTQARVAFDQLISLTTQNYLQIKTYIWVCNEYLKLQRYDDVLRVAAQAEKHFPAAQLLEINYFKAESLRGLGRCPEADNYYSIVSATTPKNAYTGSAHIGAGICLAAQKKYTEAEVEFQKSLDENADDYTVTMHAQFEMANVYSAQGDLENALKFYLLVATIYDDENYCSQGLLNAAQIFEVQKRPNQALKMYHEILDKYKDTPAAQVAKIKVSILK